MNHFILPTNFGYFSIKIYRKFLYVEKQHSHFYDRSNNLDFNWKYIDGYRLSTFFSRDIGRNGIKWHTYELKTYPDLIYYCNRLFNNTILM